MCIEEVILYSHWLDIELILRVSWHWQSLRFVDCFSLQMYRWYVWPSAPVLHVHVLDMNCLYQSTCCPICKYVSQAFSTCCMHSSMSKYVNLGCKYVWASLGTCSPGGRWNLLWYCTSVLDLVGQCSLTCVTMTWVTIIWGCCWLHDAAVSRVSTDMDLLVVAWLSRHRTRLQPCNLNSGQVGCLYIVATVRNQRAAHHTFWGFPCCCWVSVMYVGRCMLGRNLLWLILTIKSTRLQGGIFTYIKPTSSSSLIDWHHLAECQCTWMSSSVGTFWFPDCRLLLYLCM